MPGAGLYLPGVHHLPARAGELARLCSYQFTTDLRSFQARFTDLPGSCAPDAVYVVGGSPGTQHARQQRRAHFPGAEDRDGHDVSFG